MKTYSLDLRERVLAALDRGIASKEAVGVFGVSPATLKRWLKRWLKRRDQMGSAAPKRRPGMRRRVGAAAEQRRALWRQLEENPEATLERHRVLWEEQQHGVRVSLATMSRAIRRLGWTYTSKDGGPLRARRAGPSPLARAGRAGLWTPDVSSS